MKINITHILLFLIIICLLYTLLSNCGCNKDGFSVGGQGRCLNTELNNECNRYTDIDSCISATPSCGWEPPSGNGRKPLDSSFLLSTRVVIIPDLTTETINRYISLRREELISILDNNHALGTRIYLKSIGSIRTSQGEFYSSNNTYYAYSDSNSGKYILVSITEEGLINTEEISSENLNRYFTITNPSQPSGIDASISTIFSNDSNEMYPDITGIGQLHSTRSPTSSDDQINNLCDISFDIPESRISNTYYNMGYSDIGGDSPGRCCRSVQNLYDNYPEIISNASPEIQINLYNYGEGCADAGHIDSDSSPGASSIVDRIACQGIMDDVHCQNGGTLESSPTCRCECPQGPQGYFGENCEKSCQRESNRIVPIINRLFETDNRDLLNEQEQIEVNSYLDFCQ